VAQFHFYNRDFNPDLTDHGREFRACYQKVTEILLGREAAMDLGITLDLYVSDKPGTIITVPSVDPSLDPDGVGIFPRWRSRKQADELEGLRQRIAATLGAPRLNGAIAL
jgi:hypothetical protein